MTQEELNTIAENHAKWLKSPIEGTRAHFTAKDFSGLSFKGFDFTRAAFYRCLFLRCAMSNVNFTDAVLRNSNFGNTSLTGAILTGADLENVIGNTREIKSLQVVRFPITYTSNVVQIGCRQCPIASIHEDFNNIIQELGGKHSHTWDTHREYLETLLKISPATKTL